MEEVSPISNPELAASTDQNDALNGRSNSLFMSIVNKTPDNITAMANHSVSVECSLHSGLNYQAVSSGGIVHELSSDTPQKPGFDKSEPLQNIPQNAATVDFHSAYYDEIMNFISRGSVSDHYSTTCKSLLKRRAKNYSVKDGTLFYGTKRVLKTKLEQLQMLENTHVEENTGVHLGVKKMSRIINAQCFWRGHYVDIANFVRQCSKCTEVRKEPMEHIAVVEDRAFSEDCEIWQKVEVHLQGPYSKSDAQSVFIATIVDTATHYVAARLVAVDNCAVNLSHFILDTFCTFGVVKCYFSKSCIQYLEAVKIALKQLDDTVRKVKLSWHQSLQDLLFSLPPEKEQCLWIQSCLEPYVTNFLSLNEMELCIYIFELNTKITDSSPFIRMFNRHPFTSLQENKENANINLQQNRNNQRNSQRRLLRSSVLQCRHCEEIFTSKISFRIHQRKHTEEARRRGMLEGQTKFFGEGDRRVLRRPLSKHRCIAVKRRSSSYKEDRQTVIAIEERSQSSLRADIPERRRAELRANTVEAVRLLLAKTRDDRKRRGKYKKFPTEIQEQMARYAMDHGSLLTVRHFSEKLGVIVSESTVRNIMKWYRCFTPEIKEEIGRFSAEFGIEAAASHFTEYLGREVRVGLIRRFKKMYLSRFSDAKQNIKKRTTKVKLPSINKRLSAEMEEEIGRYANEHTIAFTIYHFFRQYHLNLKEQVVFKCRKLYQEKQNTVHKQPVTNRPSLHQQQLSSDLHQQPQEQQAVHRQQQHQQQPKNFHCLQQQQHQKAQQRQLQPSQTQLPQQLQVPQQHEQQQNDMQRESLSYHPSGVGLVSLQHQSNISSIQETSLQSSTQTIDILQTSLNLLNNPQLNNPTAIIYNTPYQMPSTSNIPSNQLIPLNQQQNIPITFQTTNQCIDSNIPTSVPLPYQSQEVPMSASVIINQNVATVQTFPNTQMYPAFAQPHSVPPATLTVSEGNLQLPPAGAQIPNLSHHPPDLPNHSGLSTIAVAVAPLAANSHFQASNNQPTIVLSQSVSQPILVSHSQTGSSLLQHIIDSQPHIPTNPTLLPQHMINEVHSSARANTSQPFPQVVEQHPVITSQTFSHTLGDSMPTVTCEASAPYVENEGNSMHTVACEVSAPYVENEGSSMPTVTCETSAPYVENEGDSMPAVTCETSAPYVENEGNSMRTVACEASAPYVEIEGSSIPIVSCEVSAPYVENVGDSMRSVACETSAPYLENEGSSVPTVTCEISAPYVENEDRNTNFSDSGNSQSVERMEMKGDDGYSAQLQNIESQVSQTKITDKAESNLKASIVDPQAAHSQYSLISDCTKKDEVICSQNNALKMDCQKNNNNETQCDIGSNSSSRSSSNSNVAVRKNCQKKRAMPKGKGKESEHKRGSYAVYSPEVRAEMGKYAAEHGSQKACDYFKNKHGYNVADSTMRGLRDKYLKKREMYSCDSDEEVTSLGYAPRGRPMRLGQYDVVVQECLQELAKSGEKISSFLAITTAKHVLMQYEPHLLEENGGKIKLNVTWAKSFLKRCGIKNYS